MQKSFSRAMMVVALFVSIQAGPGGTFTVTTTNDSGPGSLRQALLNVNGSAGSHSIRFDLSGLGTLGVHTIAPLSPLPEISNPVDIDGYTQSGSSANTLPWGNDAVLRVRLDGINLTNTLAPALTLRSNSSTVRGLIIVRFPLGIEIDSGSGNVIAGNWIGVDFDGIARGMTFDGVFVTCAVFGTATRNVIGGEANGDRNVISGNSRGVFFFPETAANNSVVGNFIGTDPSGRLPRGNIFQGVMIQGATNILVKGNVLAASTGAGGCGVDVLGGVNTSIQGNLIGLSVTGHDLGHSASGISAMGTTGLAIGTADGTGSNYIDCNRRHGIELQGCSGAVIQGNVIGSASSGGEALGNLGCGIYLFGSSTNQIGPRNEVLYNGAAGVAVVGGAANRITENQMFDNGGLGIDLENDGITANDTGDADTGANQLQNFPTLSGASISNGVIQVEGVLQSEPSQTYRVEFFIGESWDPLGVPEGRVFLGSIDVTTDVLGEGKANFSTAAPLWLTADQIMLATATDKAGNTSEFSLPNPITVPPPPPTLSIARVGEAAVVSWPSPLAVPGFQLEATFDLARPGQWQRVTAGINDDGKTCTLLATNSPEQPARFFRLVKTP